MSLNLNYNYSQFNLNVVSDSDRVIYVFGDFRLDAARKMLYRGGEELAAVPKAIETLLALVERRGEIVSRDELMSRIWSDAVVEASNLSHYLYLLRRTLGEREDGKPYIETLRRRGYRFTAEVSIVGDTVGLGGEPADERAARYYLEDRESETTEAFETELPKLDFTAAETPTYVRNGDRRTAVLAAAVAMISMLMVGVYLHLGRGWSGTAASPRGAELSLVALTNGRQVLAAAISRDGKYLVYHEYDGDVPRLWLQQTNQATRIEIVPPAPREIGGKGFSPNGDFIYYSAREKGAGQISLYRVPTLGGEPVKIADDAGPAVSISPDGRELAFVRTRPENGETQLVAVSGDGGRERVLTVKNGTEAVAYGSAWSPDGKTIAYGVNHPNANGNHCRIERLNLTNGSVTFVSEEKWDTCYGMDWTRDGEALILIGTRAGDVLTVRRDQVFYIDVHSGESRRLTTDGNRYQEMATVTDGDEILAVPHKRLSQIWLVGANGAGGARQLTQGATDGRIGLAALPDGRVGYTARIGENLTLWTMNADGSDQKMIFGDMPQMEELRATADGCYFVFSGRRENQSHLYRIDRDGGNLRQLTFGDSSEVDSTISPDGRSVYFVSNRRDGDGWRTELKKTSIEGGESSVVDDSVGSTFAPHLSPDGKTLSGIVGDSIILQPIDGRNAARVFKVAAFAWVGSGARWSPDAKYLTYIVARNNVGNIWKQPVDGGEPSALTDFTTGEIFNYSFSADGTKLYVSRGYQFRDAVLIKNIK